MKGRKKSLVLFFCLLTSIIWLWFVACNNGSKYTDDPPSQYGSISFSLAWEGGPTDEGRSQRAAVVCTDIGVDTIRAEVIDGSDNFVASGGPWNCSDHSGTISGIAPGSGYTVVLYGMDDQGDVLYQGRQSGITVTAGSTTNEGEITMVYVELTYGLLSIGVTPAAPSIARGTSQQFTATGTYADQGPRDLTDVADWYSTNTSVATISNTEGSQGRAMGLADGNTTISASIEPFIGAVVTGSTSLTVTDAELVSIEVTPTNPSIALGTTRQFTASGTYTDQTVQDLTDQVTWSSSNTGVATISNAAGSQGLATSVAEGNTIISAAMSGITGTTELTVTSAELDTITLAPTNPSIVLGTNQQFTASGIYTDQTVQNLTDQVTWSSSNTGVATISNAAGSQGLATSVAEGNTIISAAMSGITGTTELTVTSAVLETITITPVDLSITIGTSQQFMAIGTYSDQSEQVLTTQVTWSSSDTDVATISNAAGSNGLATSITAGSTTIQAVDPETLISETTGLTILPSTSNRAYIANEYSNTVSVLDIDLASVVDTITVADDPWGVAVHPGQNLVYVTHYTQDMVSVIDTTTNTVVTTVTVGDNPQSVAVNPVRNKAYVANPGSWGSGNDTVTIIDTTNQSVIATVVVGEDPTGIAIADQGNAVGVFVSLHSGTVVVIDVVTNAITHTIPIPGTNQCPENVAYLNATYRMYVLHNTCNAPFTANGYLTRILTTTKAVETTFQLGAGGVATGLTVDTRVGGNIYVTHPQSDTLSVTEYVYNSLEAEIAVGDFPSMAAYAGSSHDKVLVSNCTGNSISVIDINSNSVVDTVTVGNCPRGIGIIP